MAIIKRTPRPGELVRGATAGDLAAFGPDGELVDSGKDVEDFIEVPESGNVGDVLAKGSDGPEWVGHYPAGGSEGNVLTKGASGPEWAAPEKRYCHSVRIWATHSVVFPVVGTIAASIRTVFNIISKSATPFTFETLRTYLTDHYTEPCPCNAVMMPSDLVYPTGETTGPKYRLKYSDAAGFYTYANTNITCNRSILHALDESGAIADSVTIGTVSYLPGSSNVDDKVTEI